VGTSPRSLLSGQLFSTRPVMPEMNGCSKNLFFGNTSPNLLPPTPRSLMSLSGVLTGLPRRPSTPVLSAWGPPDLLLTSSRALSPRTAPFPSLGWAPRPRSSPPSRLLGPQGLRAGPALRPCCARSGGAPLSLRAGAAVAQRPSGHPGSPLR